MSEESKESGDHQERRNGSDRRSGEDQRKENRGIRNAPFFRLLLDRRKGQDRRVDERQAGDSSPKSERVWDRRKADRRRRAVLVEKDRRSGLPVGSGSDRRGDDKRKK